MNDASPLAVFVAVVTVIATVIQLATAILNEVQARGMRTGSVGSKKMVYV